MAVEAFVAQRRKMTIYKMTISPARIGVRERRVRAVEYLADVEALGGLPERPRTYGDCERAGLGLLRPCPWVGCSQHLALEVTESGGITFWWPDRDVTEIPETCALAAVKRHPEGLTLAEIGALTNLTRERIRQIECEGLRALRGLSELARVQDEVT